MSAPIAHMEPPAPTGPRDRAPARTRQLTGLRRKTLLGVSGVALTAVALSWVAGALAIGLGDEGASTGALLVRLTLGQFGALVVLLPLVALVTRPVITYFNGLFAQQDRIMHTVSHDVSKPLSRLMAILDDAKAGATPPDAAAREAAIEVDHLTAFVDDVTEAGKILSGAMEMPTDPVDLTELAARVARLSEIEEITIEVAAERVTAVGSLGMLRLAVTNLVRNSARHAYQNGPGVVRIEVDAQGIRVLDEGPGIPPDRLAVLLRPRPGDVLATEVGLGLSSADWVAELHGGALRLVNRPSGGLEVRLELPTRPAEPAPDAEG